MAKRRRSMLDDSEPSENFWPSFTDLISTVALILFVLVLMAYIQNLISGKQLAGLRAQLHASAAQLAGSQRQIASAEVKLRTLAAELQAGQAQLALSQAQVEAQRSAMADSNHQLETLRGRLQGVALLRLDLVDRVRKSLETQLGGAKGGAAPSVSLAGNGNIVINESLLFEFNSYTVKPAGKTLIGSLGKAFANVLAEPALRESIDVILVQGHTDERGTLSYNRELSAKRANAVLDRMLEENPQLASDYDGFFASSAYSESRPVSDEKNESGYEKNRRIEISVVLKDTSVRGLIDEYMRNVGQGLGGQPPSQ